MTDDNINGRIALTPEGWIVEYGGKRVVIFDDIRGLSCNLELAQALGVEPPRAWVIKEQLLDKWNPSLDEVRCLFPRIVGEDDNVKLASLSLFTLKLKDPGERLMGVIVEGSNSVGKSHFSKNILKPLQMEQLGPEPGDTRVIEFTRMTGAFLERALANKNLDRRILFMQEISNAPYQLHLTLSEGKLKIGIVERQDGEFKPVEIEAQGQPFLWATSVEWHGSPDLIHRCIVLTMDESVEQTRKITEFQAKLSADLFYKKRMEAFERGCIKIFLELWRSAPDNCVVIIPFLELIQKELTKTNDLSVKFRRDFNKLVSLIKGCAILNHKNRVKLSLNGETVIIASFEDFLEVYKLMKAALQPTLTGLNEKDVKVLAALKELENTMELPTYTALSKKTGIPYSTIRHHIAPKLENLGFIAVDRELRPHRVEMLRDGPREILDNIEGLREEAEKLIKDAMAHLSSLSCGQLANAERSPDKASIPEKKPEELAKLKMANDPGFSGQKEAESSPVHDWPNGRGEITGDGATATPTSPSQKSNNGWRQATLADLLLGGG
jgi:DNA-binding transcriptional ArsR family regulator